MKAIRASIIICLLMSQGCSGATGAAPGADASLGLVGRGPSSGLIGTNTGNLIANNTGNLIANNAGSLIANNAGSFSGTVRGPSAGLIANNSGGLIANNLGGLIANNAGSLISNNSGGYRVLDLAGLTQAVGNATVAIYDQKGGRLSDLVVTDANGAFTVSTVRPSGPLVYVRASYAQEGQAVILEAAAAAPRRPANAAVTIDPAVTLVSKKVADIVRQGVVGEDRVNPDLISQIAQKIAPQLDASAVVGASILTNEGSAGVFDGLLRSQPDLRHAVQALADAVGPGAGTMVTLQPVAGLVASNAPSPPPAGTHSVGVITFSGSGSAGFADGSGTAAQFQTPGGLAMDGQKNVYVADSGNHRIRKIAPDGTTTTLAGSTAGFSDGPSALARFNNPTGVAVDAAGAVYVADTGNQRIRKIAPDGSVSTFAGAAAPGFVDGQGAVAAFNSPTDLIFDTTSNLYVVDSGNHAVRKVAADGTVSTLAGNGTAGYADGTGKTARFNAPSSIAFNGRDAFFVADQLNFRVRKVSLAGQVTLLAGSGATTSKDGLVLAAGFARPSGVAVDAAGNVYVADAYSQNIREVTVGGSVITLSWNDSNGSAARFNGPSRLILDSANGLYVTDSFNHRIRHVQ